MEEIQQLQQQQRPSFPPGGVGGGSKWQDLGPSAHDGGSFGQDSGYTSYQATTPNNTLNHSSRHGASGTLATIDECNEIDCSMNDSSTGLLGAIDLTPRTAASMDLLSNIHLTTPKSATDRAQRIRNRPNVFDYDGSVGSSASISSFQAPSTPERLPRMLRSQSFETQETPLRTGNRSANHPASQLTPHKARGGSQKRKHSAFREKLYADARPGTDDAMLASSAAAGDENDPRDLNDSFDADCRRLEDISPIPNVKRRKHLDRGIEDLIRSSTPKTVSSKPSFLRAESNENIGRPAANRRKLRKFQSFSPSKIQSNARIGGRIGGLGRQNAFRPGGVGLGVEKTPEKKQNIQRVLAEIHQQQQPEAIPLQAPIGFEGLLEAPILEEPSTAQLEQTVTTVPSFEDFSLTPLKVPLIDPELAEDDCIARHAPDFSYAPTLNSILEESPIKAQFIPEKLPLPKTPPSVTKSARKLKRLGTNESLTSLTSSYTASPARSSVRSLSRASLLSRASVSPKRRLPQAAQYQRLHTKKPYSYCGFQYLNILQQLSKHNLHALETLLDYIDVTDLVQVVRVSRGWRAIIHSHPKSWRRLQCHLKEREQHKENNDGSIAHSRITENASFALGGCAKVDREVGPNGSAATEGKAVLAEQRRREPTIVPVVEKSLPKRQPFKIRNSLDNSQASSAGKTSFSRGSFVSNVSGSDASRPRSSTTTSTVASIPSPPVSPSMRRFVANQKVVARLKPSEQLRPCPRCRQPSRILYSRASIQTKSRTSSRSSGAGAQLEKSYTLPDPDAQCSYAPDVSHRNNNEYPELQQLSNDSPNRVRKNLFNSTSGDGTLEDSRTDGLKQRMKLRSSTTSKSLNSSQSSETGDDQLDVRDSKCDYAICTGQLCGFRFCIKCLGNYHPNTICADLSVNSPTKEEERERSYIACSRENRRALLRLCRKF